VSQFFDRFRRPAEPTDEETAEAMRDLAEVFRSGSKAEGVPFGWGPDEADRLDGLCDAFLATGPTAERRHSVVMSMGAFLGELLVRNGGGLWAYDTKENAAVVVLPNGLRAFPHNKVAKRLDLGPEQSISAFYRYALTRE
jgi:hypothetical protein